ncbi:MAG TPA: SpoIIE family protein phosphatase [Bacteroidales bacterium]|nr:SpoIIE family protein phosphatase [Bacteroidales bacterium]
MRGSNYSWSEKNWIRILHDPEKDIASELANNSEEYKKKLLDQVAEFLFAEMKRTEHFEKDLKGMEFNQLDSKGKTVWYEAAASIPVKIELLGLQIRPWSSHFHTCIITDEEINRLTKADLEKSAGRQKIPVEEIPDRNREWFRELNYMIPVSLVKAGFELIRPEEVTLADNALTARLARAIHSRYLQNIRNRRNDGEKTTAGYPGDKGNIHLTDYDNLPEEIRFSNYDNAVHIPSKLLSIGYRIKPVKEGHSPYTLQLNEEEIENMARLEHLRWCWDKRLNGWIHGNRKDADKKTHPGLVPYELLPEQEKEKDRALVRLIPSLLQDIGCMAYPVIPDQTRKLSYAIKPRSSIARLLSEIKKLNHEISGLTESVPGAAGKLNTINSKIEDIIAEVQGNYNYAQHIQQVYLPDDLYIRECFPDSFVLYRPLDLVSGDFYFFSKTGDSVIFAVGDCTGHGIPGALLSILGYSIFDQAVNQANLECPSEILGFLYSGMHKFLRQNEEGTSLSDDLDIAVCHVDLSTRMLDYSGVKNPLYLIRNGELLEYKARNLRPGMIINDDIQFVSDLMELKTGDTIYIFSDGYADQLGGPHHKRFQSSTFKSLLLDIQDHSMTEQKELLYAEIETWRKKHCDEQTDDITIVGVRI